MQGVYRIMFLLMYGAGSRHRECRTLRVKDICFESRQILVRDGKGMKDRVTVLPDNVVPLLRQHLASVRVLHTSDLQDGLRSVTTSQPGEQLGTQHVGAARFAGPAPWQRLAGSIERHFLVDAIGVPEDRLRCVRGPQPLPGSAGRNIGGE